MFTCSSYAVTTCCSFSPNLPVVFFWTISEAMMCIYPTQKKRKMVGFHWWSYGIRGSCTEKQTHQQPKLPWFDNNHNCKLGQVLLYKTFTFKTEISKTSDIWFINDFFHIAQCNYHSHRYFDVLCIYVHWTWSTHLFYTGRPWMDRERFLFSLNNPKMYKHFSLSKWLFKITTGQWNALFTVKPVVSPSTFLFPAFLTNVLLMN